MVADRSGGLVSVVIPVHNGAAFLREAVESALTQDGYETEVVVVDDGSTDQSREVAAAIPGVRCLAVSHGGPSSARNAGVEASSGEFLAFLDADDLWPPGKLSIQVSYLRSHPDVGCVLGRQELLIEPGVALPDWVTAPPMLAYGETHPGPTDQLPPMSMVVPRRVFDEVGPFDTRFTLGEDVDWILRLLERGIRIEQLEDVVLIRRLHGSNLTYDTAGLRRSMFEVLKARIDRRRAST
jgi:glycosyltransferase involved in cell wall biosynthesis